MLFIIVCFDYEFFCCVPCNFCFSCFRTTLLQCMKLLQYDCGNELCQKITIKFFFFLKTFDFFHQLSVFCIIIQCFNFYLSHILYIRTVSILTVQRVENSLSGFSSESLVFCERKSEIVICCFPQKKKKNYGAKSDRSDSLLGIEKQ